MTIHDPYLTIPLLLVALAFTIWAGVTGYHETMRASREHETDDER